MSLSDPREARRDAQPVPLDAIDRGMIDALMADGRLSMRSLADRLHVSRAGIYSRLDRLHRTGVITGYAAIVDPQRTGLAIAAYVNVRIRQNSWKTVRERIGQIPEVEHAALVSGDNDLVLHVRTKDAASLRELVLNVLQAMPEVRSTQTVLIFDELPAMTRSPAAASLHPDLPDDPA